MVEAGDGLKRNGTITPPDVTPARSQPPAKLASWHPAAAHVDAPHLLNLDPPELADALLCNGLVKVWAPAPKFPEN